MNLFRDFVSVRYYEKTEDYYASSTIAVTHPQAPPTKQYIRYIYIHAQ